MIILPLSYAHAQKSFKVQLISPPDGYEIAREKDFPLQFKIFNNGTVPIVATDSFELLVSLDGKNTSSSHIPLSGFNIPAGDSTAMLGTNSTLVFSAAKKGVAFCVKIRLKQAGLIDSSCSTVDLLLFPANVKTQSQASARIYPNPAGSEIKLDVTGSTHAAVLRIFDLYGRLVKTCAMQDASAKVYVGDVPAGTYICIVTDKNDNLILKQKLRILGGSPE